VDNRDRLEPKNSTTARMIEISVRLPLDRFALEVRHRSEAAAIALFGPSGSGKTSLLEVIAGLRRASTGRVVVDGEVLADSSRRVWVRPERRRVGYVPQDSLLFPHLDVRGNVRFGLKDRGVEGERRFQEAVEILEIGALLSRRPYSLSGGERQRVALARALATAPRLLLLDEPLAALDVELKERILPYLLRVRATQTRMLYVTHNVGEAIALADEAIVLRGGVVEASGTPREVLTLAAVASTHPQVRFDNVLDGTIAARDDAEGTVTLALPGGGHLVATAAPDLVPGARATFAVSAEDILVATRSLDGISARNVLEGKITAVDRPERRVLVRAEASGREWSALVTQGAARALGLTEAARGRPVWLVIKTHALRRLR
jgi:molybdate transport system ATP-binding protein